MVANPDTVKVVDRTGTGWTFELSLAGRRLRLVYDPRETGPFCLLDGLDWVETPGQPIERADLDRSIELLRTERLRSPILERVEPQGCYVVRAWQRGGDVWLARVVCHQHPWPDRPGHGDIECVTLGRTASVPFIAPATSGGLIGEPQWAQARWIYPAAALLTPQEQAQLAAWLAQAKDDDFFLTSPGWILREPIAVG